MSKRFTSDKPIITLFEDEHFIAFYKPAGLLAVPASARDGKERSLEELVNDRFRRRPEMQSQDVPTLHPCHRIDRETSGIMLFAKGKKNQQLMMELFHQKKIEKKYTAFVHGRVTRPTGTINFPVKDAYEAKFSPGGDGKDALTHYRVLEVRKQFSIVEAMPVTGRTNQIRIHFKMIHHPIVGENKYIFRKDFALKFKRTALHAAELAFEHPVTHEAVRIEANLSVDMKNFLERNPV
ncbi:MAG: RluA family pseudouridine synthase [Candidatus Omnitrophica bacterium]|nr:RluA family pseudouridine synthase [Candidatus Omnitrophota bacterium]